MRDKVVFITGGNSGIGLATSLAFAREGTHVAILSRRATENSRAKARIEAEGVRCLAFDGDVTVDEDVAKAVSETADALDERRLVWL